MSDINETLMSNYQEALDIGMECSEAMQWAKEKTHGYRDSIDKVLTKDDLYEKNISDLQKQLHNAETTIVKQREIIENVVKIIHDGIQK